MRYGSYKSMLMETVQDIKKAIAEGDHQHVGILFDRLEKQIANRYRGY